MHIRCLAHVINLVVQSFLHAIDEAEDPEINDYFDKEAPVHFDIDKDADQIGLEAEALAPGANDYTPADEDEDVAEDEAVLIEDVNGQSPLQRVSTALMPILHNPLSYKTIQLRFITTKIVSSPQRRLRFCIICRNKYGNHTDKDTKRKVNLMVVRDVRTRWNYTHAMIRHAYMLKEVSQ